MTSRNFFACGGFLVYSAGRTLAFVLAVGLLGLGGPAPATEAGSEDATSDCLQGDGARRIRGCSQLLENPALPQEDRAMAFALRALSYSIQGDYDQSLMDYDEAIRLSPDFAAALNNRAWTYYKAGRAAEGMADVERSLVLSPWISNTHDTRAHINQALGRVNEAMVDYEFAMRIGGERIVKLYQCGLQAIGLYNGEIDGRNSVLLKRALETCVAQRDCDPLPADEECRKLTS